jgi:N-methylhydantoinase B/oxoprolinase/acetone carboxylase alpha subunit
MFRLVAKRFLSVKNMNADQLRVQILEQGNVVKSLKSSKAAKGDIDAQVATLLSLKDQLAQLTGVSVDKSSKRTLVLKTPKVPHSA